SSRRRHTSSDRDWSSDVCSSDLPDGPLADGGGGGGTRLGPLAAELHGGPAGGPRHPPGVDHLLDGEGAARPAAPPPRSDRRPHRSEERRVGKEGGCLLTADQWTM